MDEYRVGKVVKGRVMWQLDPDHTGLLVELERARETALSEIDKRREAEARIAELESMLARVAAGLDRLSILHPAAREHIDGVVRAVWAIGKTEKETE